MLVLAQRRRDQCADALDHVDIAYLVVAPDIVRFAELALLDHGPDGLAVVFHVEPVANVEALAVHGQRLTIARVQDDDRDQLLRELERAVVVRAVGDLDRHLKCAVVGAH